VWRLKWQILYARAVYGVAGETDQSVLRRQLAYLPLAIMASRMQSCEGTENKSLEPSCEGVRVR
jgi:hypothetical protein